MSGGAMQLALRELQGRLGRGRAWAAVGLVGAVAGLTGPFGTFDMPPLPRLAYWLVIAGGSYALGMATGALAAGLLRRRPGPLLWLALAALPGLPVALLVTGVDLLTFGWRPRPLGEFLSLAGYCAAISVAVALASRLARGAAPAEVAPSPAPSEAPAPGPPPTTGSPRLLARLPPGKRGRLLHLRMADHYVEVVTDRGAELVLLRMADAVAETAPVAGLQVHRSHWVAVEAVRRGLRREGRPVLELVNGTEVPVSRSHLAAVRAAGLVP